MKAGLYNLNIEQGADWTLDFSYKDADKNPFDFTGCTVSMQIRPSFNSKDVVLEVKNQAISGYKVILTLNSILTSQIKIDTKKLTWNEGRQAQAFVYDIEITDLSGQLTRILQGQAFIYPEVTKC
jgi:hypothetical protein